MSFCSNKEKKLQLNSGVAATAHTPARGIKQSRAQQRRYLYKGRGPPHRFGWADLAQIYNPRTPYGYLWPIQAKLQLAVAPQHSYHYLKFLPMLPRVGHTRGNHLRIKRNYICPQDISVLPAIDGCARESCIIVYERATCPALMIKS